LSEKYGSPMKEWRKNTGSEIIEKIKIEERKKEFDCIIGLSGGVDSSYLAYLAVQRDYGLWLFMLIVAGILNRQ
jgi:tRNA(Ile)-lysidine synthase TilS/MesJ